MATTVHALDRAVSPPHRTRPTRIDDKRVSSPRPVSEGGAPGPGTHIILTSPLDPTAARAHDAGCRVDPAGAPITGIGRSGRDASGASSSLPARSVASGTCKPTFRILSLTRKEVPHGLTKPHKHVSQNVRGVSPAGFAPQPNVAPVRLLTLGEISGKDRRGLNVPSLPKRNRRYVYNQLLAKWLRITEDGTITKFEMMEFGDDVNGVCLFADAIDTTHVVSQALPRATDAEYVGDLVAMQQATLAVLPDAREAA